jgi:hypothetical protein
VKEFFDVRAPAEFVRLTTRELARLAHKAEDTGDDILLLQVQDEVDRRERRFPHLGVTDRFREEYVAMHRTRGA